MSTSSTEIVPTIQAGLVALKQDGATLKTVAEALAEPYHPDVARTEDIPFPPVPKPVEMTPEVKEALQRLPEVFGVVQPETRRTLTDDEKRAVYAEQQVLKIIGTLIGQREDCLKTIIRHHMDVDAEERGVAVSKAVVDPDSGEVIVPATDRDKTGHYVLCAPQQPERCPIPGENVEWSREYRKGDVSVGVEPQVLAQWERDGEISREDYLAVTREVRVFDERKAFAALHDGDPGKQERLAALIKRITHRAKPSVALCLRKPKK